MGSAKAASSQTKTPEEAETKCPTGVKLQKMLQVFVRGPLITKTLCLQLDPETTISSLKELIQSKTGVHPKDQNLHIWRHFQLCDLLTVADHGIQNDQNIELRMKASGLLGGGPGGHALDDMYILELSRKLGYKWIDLAIRLGCTHSEIANLKEDNYKDLHEQGRMMLTSWFDKQENVTEASCKLKKTLEVVDLIDLASEVPERKIPGDSQKTKCDSAVGNVHQAGKASEDPEQSASSIEEHFLDLSKEIQSKWKILAKKLGFMAGQIDAFENDSKDYPPEQARVMLVDWWQRQEDITAAYETLKHFLEEPGVMDTLFDVQSCAKELANHYLNTMKMTTHPQEKINELYVNQKLLKETNFKKPHNSSSQCEDLYEDSYGDMLELDKKRILIIAEAGYGKTTLFKRIAYDWADINYNDKCSEDQTQPKYRSHLKGYKLVFVLEANRIGHDFDIVNAIFSQILTDSKYEKIGLKKFIQGHQDDVLILIDGTDEISFQSLESIRREEKMSLKSVLSYESLKSCKVIVTSRKYTAGKLLKLYEHYSRINVAGFDENDREIYAGKCLKHFKKESQKSFLQQVNCSKTLCSLGEVPLFFHVMCHLWMEGSKLPNPVTKLFREKLKDVLYEHKQSKKTNGHAQESTHDTHFTQLGKIALEGFLNENGVKLFFSESEIDSEDREHLNQGFHVGLLSKTKTAQKDCCFSFLHKIFQEYCAAAYLVDLSTSNADLFDEKLTRIFDGDVEGMELVLRFCCGLDGRAAETIIRRNTGKLVKQKEPKTSLQRIAMLLLFETQSESLVKECLEAGRVDFPYQLTGDDLLAADYLINIGSTMSYGNMADITQVDATCQYLDELKLLYKIMNTTRCMASLTLSNISSDSMASLTLSNISSDSIVHEHDLKDMFKFVQSLQISHCGFNSDNLAKLLKIISESDSEMHELTIRNNASHDLLPKQNVGPVACLQQLHLCECGLTNSDIEPLFALIKAAGSIQRVVLIENNLQGLQAAGITPVPSLVELVLERCGLTSSDIVPLFALIKAAGSIRRVVLNGNNLQGLQALDITGVPFLELHLSECGLTNNDLQPLLVHLSATDSVRRFVLN